MTAKELDEFAEVMARRRLLRLRVQGAELEMSPLGFEMPNTSDEPIAQQVGVDGGIPTEDELMLWSAGGPLPDVKAKPPEDK